MREDGERMLISESVTRDSVSGQMEYAIRSQSKYETFFSGVWYMLGIDSMKVYA